MLLLIALLAAAPIGPAPSTFATATDAPEVMPPRVLSVYQPQSDYVLACASYLETGDETRIAVDIGEGEIGKLECEDYPEAMPIVARRARERAFRAWYAAAAKRLRLNADPDAKAHCYDYRGFFDAFRAGQFPEVKRGGRFPATFQTACHAAE